MYTKIIDLLNSYLASLEIPTNTLNPAEFQGILVKKLSNQNIIKDKRRIPAGSKTSSANQTHIDITGKNGMLFFFESLNNHTTDIQSIDVDLFMNNFRYLTQNDSQVINIVTDGTKYIQRSTVSNTALIDNSTILHSTAFKKYGHAGTQVQINIPDSEEVFSQFHKLAFEEDALVMLRYDYQHYLSLLIPSQLCVTLYSLTKTSGSQNVNYVALNPSYNPKIAHDLQKNHIINDFTSEIAETNQLQNTLLASATAGTDVEKMVKARISQGAFRRLLLLANNHKCQLCNVTTTSVLRASHIKEWSISTKEERMDSDNGLLLCANHDTLFDRHLISFDPNTGGICISKSLNYKQRESLNLSERFNICINERTKHYMKIHYQKFKDKEN